MYKDEYSEEIIRKLIKIKKKDGKQFQKILKKIDWILENPNHNYKFLSYDMKGVQRIHINHFVLIFIINHTSKIISFEDYDHHDKIYESK